MESSPEQMVSSRTSSADEGDSAASDERHVGPASPKRYRVTNLSMGPASMIGSIITEQLIKWTLLSVHITTIRVLASHYLRSQGIPIPYGRRLFPSPYLRNIGLRSIGITLSRLALCSALEVAFKLSLWGCQWALTVFVGKTWFSWGKLEASDHENPDSGTTEAE